MVGRMQKAACLSLSLPHVAVGGSAEMKSWLDWSPVGGEQARAKEGGGEGNFVAIEPSCCALSAFLRYKSSLENLR